MLENSLDLYVISGFLGAGKTTLLQRLLYNMEGKKIGVLVNEFGGFGIDGKVLDSNGIKLIEINNGSIFCSCLKGEFVKTLIELTRQDIEVLLIENSGMADPSNMNKLLSELEGKVERSYNYCGAVCVVDTTSFLKHIRVLAPVQNQVAASSLIIVNKTDLANRETINDIRKKILSINNKAYIYETMFGEVPVKVIQQHLSNNGYVGETSNQDWNRPATYSIECREFVDLDAVKEFTAAMTAYALRIKGLVQTAEGWYKLDSVGDVVETEAFRPGKRDVIQYTKLVLIGKDATPYREELEKNWKRFFRIEMETIE